MKYVLIKYKKLNLLINEGLNSKPLIEHLEEIELLNKEVICFYKNMLNADDESSKKITKKQQTLISKIGYKIIGVPFTNHDAELYAIDKELDYQILELKKKPLTNTEKSKALRERRESLGLKEMRGIWANNSEQKILKKLCRDKLKEIRKDS